MRAKNPLAIGALAAVIIGASSLTFWLTVAADDEDQDLASPADVRPHVGPTIKLGPEGQVTSLLSAEGSVWVAGYDVPGPNSVVRIDPVTGEVVARISLQVAPTWETGGDGMAAGAGAVWVTGSSERGALLQRIDPATNEVVATVRLGPGPGADVAVDDSGVWVTAFGPQEQVRLLRIDPTTNRVVATVPIPGHWVREVLTFNGAIVVRSLPRSRLTVIDPASDDVIASRPIKGAFDLGPFGAWDGAVWAGRGRKLLRIDPGTARAEGQPIAVGTTISWASIESDDDGFWFVGYDPKRPKAGARIVRFNRSSEEIDASIDPPKSPIALALASDSIWALNYEGSVTRIALR